MIGPMISSPAGRAFWRRWSFFLLLLCLIVCVEAKPPQIGARDVKNKLDEILKTHVFHKRLTPGLGQRILLNFLEEMDPAKTYFLLSDVESWLQPSDGLLEQCIQGFRTADFKLFYEMHAQFLHAIERRNRIEERIASMPLPQGVKTEEFRTVSWATSEEELANRLLRIKALQREACAKLEAEPREKLEKRLYKRRMNYETEQGASSIEERQRLVLARLLKSSAAALDAHTTYFTPTEASQFMIQVQQRLFGIGAQLRDDLDGLSVVRILDKSPASRGNQLKLNDKIIAVDREPIIGLEIAEAVELIRGEQGTSVHLTLLRETQENGLEQLEIEMVRGEIVLEETRLETRMDPFGDGVIASLRLFSFYQDRTSSSAGDLRKAVEEMSKNQSLRGVILDLRGNGGGLLTQAVAVSGLFMQKGIVVSIKDDTGKIQHLRTLEGHPLWQGPLIVLVDRASASAAEIVAQTLQDYGRAIVVGDAHTFGKGTFQTFTLDPVDHPQVNPQGEYKVTRGRYYTVSGKSPQLHGVASDIVVPGILSQMDIGEEFAKFPLENESISPHFEDDLSDLSPFQRVRLGSSYHAELQPQLHCYTPHITRLRDNSACRIQHHGHYQACLDAMAQKNYDAFSVELFERGDLQAEEALQIMKDLIVLLISKGESPIL